MVDLPIENFVSKLSLREIASLCFARAASTLQLGTLILASHQAIFSLEMSPASLLDPPNL